ncbi:hypothetical protein [Microbispora sp. CA-102843]|uniref:hypothetical protein n=1 Tax=Microbispora sp. CA-102843 TaxID=3239952 RepID=UPI003D8FE207
MALAEHEALVRLFGERPDLAADLLTQSLRVDLPDYDYAGLESADLTEVTPTERRADSVVALRRKSPDDEPEPVLAVIVEVQRGDNIAKGKAEGQAEAILTVLSARGIEVPEDISEKIRKCHDLDRLAALLRAAATVDSSDALLNDIS